MNRPSVALVSMPWCSAWMPSIQLAVLRQCLDDVAECTSHELFVDYAATISEDLYKVLCEAGGMIEEWVFGSDYFPAAGYPMPDGFLEEFPQLGIGTREFERELIGTLVPVTRDFLARQVEAHDWGQYQVVAFSLSIYQTSASLAFARRLRERYPHLKIVFGGNSVVGPAGRALLEISECVDVVVRCEAERVFAELVRRLDDGRDLQDLPDLVFRDRSGRVVETDRAGLHRFERHAKPPCFDAYFERFERCRLGGRENIWLPFESSRGCWWGEKSQCTFCGLHDVMKYRVRPHAEVLEELDGLHARYGINRFFATDLIMPSEYYRTLLPELRRRGSPYRLFYELKANTTREMVEELAAAGVHNVQPGLESLSTSVLRGMRKGQTATQVVQFLKWCRESGVTPGWNIIIGNPGEDPLENTAAAGRAPLLHHLHPPRLIRFELDRFSPAFADPGKWGISNIRPLYLYRYVFPVGRERSQELAYRFEYDAPEFGGTPPWLGGADEDTYASDYEEAVRVWRDAHAAGAHLTARREPDGGLVIEDGRRPERPTRTHRLTASELRLWDHLDSQRRLEGIGERFAGADPAAAAGLGGAALVQARVELWKEWGLLFEESGAVVTLPVEFDRERSGPGARSPRAAVGAGRSALPSVVSGAVGGSLAATTHADLRQRVHEALGRDPGAVAGREDVSSGNAEAARIETRLAGTLFVKRLRSAREAEFGRLLRDRAARWPDVAPEFLGAARGYGVWRAVLGSTPWLTPARQRGATPQGFTEEAGERVGALVGRVHRPLDSLDDELRRAIAAWPGSNDVLRTWSDVTARGLADAPGFEFERFLAAAQSVGAHLEALRDASRPTHFVHGDPKPDNVLITAGDGRPLLVDWELAGAGDPMSDVGTLLGGCLDAWLNTLDARRGEPFEAMLARSGVRSARLAGLLDAVWRGYLASAGGPGVSTHDRRRAWSFAGLFLLERGYVANWTLGRFTLAAHLGVELGCRLLREPLALARAFTVKAAVA